MAVRPSSLRRHCCQSPGAERARAQFCQWRQAASQAWLHQGLKRASYIVRQEVRQPLKKRPRRAVCFRARDQPCGMRLQPASVTCQAARRYASLNLGALCRCMLPPPHACPVRCQPRQPNGLAIMQIALRARLSPRAATPTPGHSSVTRCRQTGGWCATHRGGRIRKSHRRHRLPVGDGLFRQVAAVRRLPTGGDNAAAGAVAWVPRPQSARPALSGRGKERPPPHHSRAESPAPDRFGPA